MDEDEIEDLANARLRDAAIGLPIVWPNKDGAAGTQLPRLEVQYFGGEADEPALKPGAGHVMVGLEIEVVVRLGHGEATTNANAYAGQVKAAFPYGLRMAGTGFRLLVDNATSIRKGYKGDGVWRTPVVVSLRTE